MSMASPCLEPSEACIAPQINIKIHTHGCLHPWLSFRPLQSHAHSDEAWEMSADGSDMEVRRLSAHVGSHVPFQSSWSYFLFWVLLLQAVPHRCQWALRIWNLLGFVSGPQHTPLVCCPGLLWRHGVGNSKECSQGLCICWDVLLISFCLLHAKSTWKSQLKFHFLRENFPSLCEEVESSCFKALLVSLLCVTPEFL